MVGGQRTNFTLIANNEHHRITWIPSTCKEDFCTFSHVADWNQSHYTTWQAVSQLSSWMSMHFCMKIFLNKNAKYWGFDSFPLIFSQCLKYSNFSLLKVNACPQNTAIVILFAVLRIFLEVILCQPGWKKHCNDTSLWSRTLWKTALSHTLMDCHVLYAAGTPQFPGAAFISIIAAYSFNKEKISWGHDMCFYSWDLFWAVLNENT